MGTRAQVLELARSQVGAVGGERYWREAFGWSGNGYPFCAVGLSWLFKKTGTDCPYFPSTVAFDRRDLGSIGGRWVGAWDLQPGDPVSFDWDGDGGGDHVGIVETRYGAGSYRTVEFNVSGRVDYRYRSASDGILGGIRPYYEEDEVTDSDIAKIAKAVVAASISYPNGKDGSPHTASLGSRVGYIDADTHTLNRKLDEIISLLKHEMSVEDEQQASRGA